MRTTLIALLVALALVACETPSGGGGGRRPAPDPEPTAPDGASPAEVAAPEEPRDPLNPGIRAKVVEVLDGNTLTVKMDGDKRRVRLLGITAPKPPGQKQPEQHFGAESKAFVEAELLGRNVKLRFMREKREDRYDRLLAYVEQEGKDFNAKMVRRGYAWADASGDHPRREEYRKLEKEARKQRRGMWASTDG